MHRFGLAGRASTLVVGSLAVVFLLSVAATFTASAPAGGPKRIDDFLGLWEGVDSLDGSPVRLSLSDINDDGIIEHTLSEGFYTVCQAEGANFSLGRGVVVGTATVVKTKDALETDTQLICIDDDGGAHPRPSAKLDYRLRSRGRNLVLPEFPDAPAIPLHRVAP